MAHGMSDDDLASFYFEKFDDDRDGSISCEELDPLLFALGVPVPENTVRKYMEKYDKDRSNSIDKKEFVALYRSISDKSEGRSLYALFKQIDTDGNATISKDEVKDFLQSIGCNFSEEKITNIMADSDLNNDGLIKFKEFCMMCRKHMKPSKK